MTAAFDRAVTALRLANARPIRPDITEADLRPLEETAPGVGAMYRRQVRAVLEAVREPDEAMLDAGGNSDGTLPINEGECKVFPAVIWRAMIDAMLRDV